MYSLSFTGFFFKPYMCVKQAVLGSIPSGDQVFFNSVWFKKKKPVKEREYILLLLLLILLLLLL